MMSPAVPAGATQVLRVLALVPILLLAVLAPRASRSSTPTPAGGLDHSPTLRVGGVLFWVPPLHRRVVHTARVAEVPPRGVVMLDGEPHYFIDRGYGGYEPRALRDGPRPGEAVVCEGAFVIKSARMGEAPAYR